MPMLYCDAFLSPALTGRASHVLHVLVALAYCGGVNISVVLSIVCQLITNDGAMKFGETPFFIC